MSRLPVNSRVRPMLARRLGWLAVGAVTLSLAWLYWLPALALSELERITGSRITATRSTLNPFSGVVRVENLRIDSVPGFEEGRALVAPKVTLAFEPLSVLEPRLRIRELEVDLASVTLVVDEAGRFNFAALGAAVQRAHEERRPVWSLAPLALVRSREIQIAKASLALQRIELVPPAQRGKRIQLAPHLTQTFEGLSSGRDLGESLLLTALEAVAAEALAAEDPQVRRSLASLARKLGTRPRANDAAVRALLAEIWPEPTRP
jgi:uncharacterized protein involved in outer membrane biogenesis